MLVKSSKGKIILFSSIVAVIYILPHLLFIFEEGQNYHLFFKTHKDAEFYAVRVREVYDGNYLNSDPFTYENKTKPYIRPFLSEFLVGTLGKIFKLSINNLFILGDFIFPAILFFLLFYFINSLTHSPALSLSGSMILLLSEIPDSLTSLLRLKVEGSSIVFTGPINPQFNYIFFVSCLIFIYKSLVNRKIINILLAGFFLGLLFYIYPYFWVYIFVCSALLFLYSLFKKEFGQIKIIFFIILEALIISIPFWINYLRLVSLPFYNETITRIAFQKSHHIIISKLSILTLPVLIIFYKKRDFNFFFLLSFLLSVLLCMNQQVLTGWIFEPAHWHYFINRELAVIVGIVLLEKLIEKARFKERFIRIFLISVLTYSISAGVITQFYNYEGNRYIESQQQYLYEAFVWLQAHTNKEDVVLASNIVSLLIPIQTHNNVYWSSWIMEYINSDKDILERFFLLARLLGMNEDEVMDYILTHKEKSRNVFFGLRYEDIYDESSEKIKINLPKDLYDYAIQRYRAFKKEDIKTLLKRFRVDYLFYSPYEQLISKGRFKIDSFLDKVYDSGGIQIYKIIK